MAVKGEVEVRINGHEVYYVYTVEMLAKGRALRRGPRRFDTRGWLQDLPAFRRYLIRLLRLGYMSEFSQQYWVPEDLR